ncbi:MAG: HEPN family nuclease [Clostridia bacterium]|nr:HEPN family nuclease [Clostridia bacterium]
MSEMERFDKEFVKITKKLLEKYYDDEEYEVTLLLNFLSALVSFPIEMNQEKNSEEAEIFQQKCVDKFKELKNQDYKGDKNRDENNFFYNIRNSIAHFNIELLPNNSEIESITLWSESNNGKRNINFKANISVNNLKKFAIYVANEYITTFFK